MPNQTLPVGQAYPLPGADAFTMVCFKAADVPAGTNLYTLPPMDEDADIYLIDRLRHQFLKEACVQGNDRVDGAFIKIAKRLIGARTAPPMVITKGERDGNWQEFDVDGHGGMIRVVARMEDDDEDLHRGKLVEQFLLSGQRAVLADERVIPLDLLAEMIDDIQDYAQSTTFKEREVRWRSALLHRARAFFATGAKP